MGDHTYEGVKRDWNLFVPPCAASKALLSFPWLPGPYSSTEAAKRAEDPAQARRLDAFTFADRMWFLERGRARCDLGGIGGAPHNTSRGRCRACFGWRQLFSTLGEVPGGLPDA